MAMAGPSSSLFFPFLGFDPGKTLLEQILMCGKFLFKSNFQLPFWRCSFWKIMIQVGAADLHILVDQPGGWQVCYVENRGKQS